MERQSMDRMDDTLIEDILYYLTFKEKVMFECLSKRVKALIYNKQTKLSVRNEDRIKIDLLRGLKTRITVTDFATAMAYNQNIDCIDKQRLTSLVKKCPNIESIDFNCFVDIEDLMIVGRHCPKLEILMIDTMGIHVDELAEFGKLYGNGLKGVRISISNRLLPGLAKWSRFLNYCPNLITLWADNVSEVVPTFDAEYLPKLKCIKDYIICFPEESNWLPIALRKLNLVCEKYCQTLEVLKLRLDLNLYNTQIDLLFDSLSKLTHLRKFVFSILEFMKQAIRGDSEQHLIVRFAEVAKHMPRLTELFVNLFFHVDCDLFLTAFESFKCLTKLSLHFNRDFESNIYNSSVQCFANNKALKFLFIRCNGITEDFFDDISTYLPNLRQIEIQFKTGTNNKTLTEISKLKKLKKFSLEGSQSTLSSITDSSVCALINGCPDIESITFCPQPSITLKTIEALITSAVMNPKKKLQFTCFPNTDIPALNLDILIHLIPFNLIIDLNAN